MLRCIQTAVTTTSRRASLIRFSSSNNTPDVMTKIDRSKVPVVNEADLAEKFVSGSGPGGQKVNKATNCCHLKHLPTGIVVKVHHTRSLDQNRKIARELLVQKLDNLYNGENSIENQKKRIALHRIATREAQSAKRRELKEQARAANLRLHSAREPANEIERLRIEKAPSERDNEKW